VIIPPAVGLADPMTCLHDGMSSAAQCRPTGGTNPMGIETIVFVVVIVLIVLFVTGYFGRGRIHR
jgi:hypothetical protein